MSLDLREAASVLGMRGDLVSDVIFAATRVAAVVQVDHSEHARRVRAGCGAVLSHEVLEALALLPHMHPIRWEDLDPLLAAVLDTAPPGVIETSPTSVRRLWRPSVAVAGVLVVSTDAASGLDAASLFAPDGRRALVVPNLESLPDWLIDEAAALGIGVVVREEQCELLVEAAPSCPARVSARHWRFLETVYDRWLVSVAYSSPQAAR